MSRILIVEDEESIAELEKDYLELSGFEVEIENNGTTGLTRALKEEFDLFILDLMLPGMDGFEICKKIRQEKNTPILMVSAKKDDIDKIRGLGLGADDYITKPFGTSELMARIRTSLRHSRPNVQTHIYQAGGLTIDFDKRQILLDGKEVHLTQIEFQLLSLLAENSGKVLTYSTIMNAIWGPYMDNNNQILRVNMANIRRKIEENPAQPKYVFTEIGIGYRMIENENSAS